MFIRRTAIKSRKGGGLYYTYRLVESKRTEKGVRQRTLVNLGTDFSLPREQWSLLAGRIEDIISSQQNFLTVPRKLESMAQGYAAMIIQSQKQQDSASVNTADYREVDINSLETIRPRSVGCEHISLESLRSLELDKKLKVDWRNFILWGVVFISVAILGAITKERIVLLFENFYHHVDSD